MMSNTWRIMAGTGSSWAMIGGDTNMKGFRAAQCVAPAGVQARRHGCTLPEAPAMQRPPMDPPPVTASEATCRARRTAV
jgi:hypothetical protein